MFKLCFNLMPSLVLDQIFPKLASQIYWNWYITTHFTAPVAGSGHFIIMLPDIDTDIDTVGKIKY